MIAQPLSTRMLPFDVCESRHRGNPASAAANPTRYAKSESHQIILAHLRHFGPLTSKELAQAMDTRVNCISGRISELLAAGQIERTDLRRDGAAVVRAK